MKKLQFFCQQLAVQQKFQQLMSTNLNFLDKYLEQLLRSKQNHYSQECINFYLGEDRFHIEDLNHVYNNHREKLKCTLIKHKTHHKNRQDQHNINSKCILYLHGLGSSRLQCLHIIQSLTKEYCICMFDLSGSGKSQGDFITYGLKQSQDIQPIITELSKKRFIRELYLWGRSMGAVATLIYAINNYSLAIQKKARHNQSINQSLKNSRTSYQTISYDDTTLLKGIILDSPFHNFRDIAKEIATKKLSVPNFILDVALDYVQSSFSKILQSKDNQKYNPFQINFIQEIRLNIPVIFLYSEKDEVVPSNHSQRIIRNMKSRFEKILINDCSHNQSRPEQVIKEILSKVQKFTRQKNHQTKKLSQSISKDITISYSNEKKRGIFIYTPSKEKQNRTIQNQYRTLNNPFITIDHSNYQNRTPQRPKSPKNLSTSLRKSAMKLKNTNVDDFNPKGTMHPLRKQISTNVTIDVQTNNLINEKLMMHKENDYTGIRMRPKRFNFQKRKQIKLTHQRYLQ